MSTLHFTGQIVREVNPRRMVYTAHDRFGFLYTIGLDVRGTNGFCAVYDPTNLETVYAYTSFDHRVHADDLKRHLQRVADRFDNTTLSTS